MQLRHPLRSAARLFARQPFSSSLIVAMLAVGIAGNATLFSFVHSLLLAPLPFRDPGRLVYLNETAPRWNLELVSIAYPDFALWRRQNRTFDGMALFDPYRFNLSTDDGPERVAGARVTHDLAAVLGLEPVLGRAFLPAEDQPGGPRVVLLGNALWRRRFGGEAGVLGRTLRLDGESYTVVGVLPPVRFPQEADLWVPLAADPEEGFGRYAFEGVGRLKEGLTPERAKADLDAVHASLIERFPYKEAVSAVVQPLREHYVADTRSTARLLMGAVGLVLAIACGNVASLMLARGMARRREVGVRLALGASRLRIAGQRLGEALVLALAGGVAGVGLAWAGLRGLTAAVGDQVPFWVRFALDPPVVLFCLAACAGSALLFGLLPAFEASRTRLAGILASAGRRSSEGGRRRRAFHLLVVAELALASMLLIAAALVVRSFDGLRQVDPGFRAADVLAFRLSLPAVTYGEPEARDAFYRSLVDRLAALPGVESAAAGTHPPLDGHTGNFFEVENAPPRDPEAASPVVLTRSVTPGYLHTLGIALLAGDGFSPAAGRPDAAAEVIVNRTFSRLFHLADDPIGRRIRLAGDEDRWLTVVGVAGDVKHYGLDKEVRPGVYLPLGQGEAPANMGIVVHASIDPHALVAPAREIVRRLDPELPLYAIATMEEQLERSLTLRRLTSWLFGVFSAVALLLAAGGIYGVVSYAVSRRTREIGIRMAVGARAAQVLGDVLRHALALAALGTALGLAGAWALGTLLTSLLFEVSSRDPWTYAAAAAGLALLALLAGLVPALRAATTDPAAALAHQ